MKLRRDDIRFETPIKTLLSLPKGRKYKLLDVGGACHLINIFLPDNIKYYSLDYVGEQDYLCNLDTLPLPIENNKFDIIVCLETLEHTLYPYDIIKELIRISKPDALFIFSVPNEYNFMCRINFLLGRKTLVQKPAFAVTHTRGHIQTPLVKEMMEFFSEFFIIRKVDYVWASSKQDCDNPLIRNFFIVFDTIINRLSKHFPSIFSRNVIFVCKKKNVDVKTPIPKEDMENFLKYLKRFYPKLVDIYLKKEKERSNNLTPIEV